MLSLAALALATVSVGGCSVDGDILLLTGGHVSEGGATTGVVDTTGASDASQTGGTGGGSSGGGVGFDVGSPLAPAGDTRIPESCQDSFVTKSSMGCSFYAVDLDRTIDADPATFAVAVANVQESAVTVEIEERSGGVWTPVIPPTPIGPADVVMFELPDAHHEGSGLAEEGSYRIASDLPVTVYQFNGTDGNKPEGAGASLLMPTSSWTSSYQLMGWLTDDPVKRPTYLSVIALLDGTEVSIHPSVPTAAGGIVDAGEEGSVIKVPMGAGDVVHVAADVNLQEVQYGLTGTLVQSGGEHPVSVLSGAACSSIPGDEQVCNHMEEQLTPHLYGEHFIAPRMPVRDFGNPEDTLWLIQALEDNTIVTLEGKVSPNAPEVRVDYMDAGDVIEVWAGGTDQTYGDIEIWSTKHIAVMGYVTNATEFGGESFLGGPEMVQLSPVDRFLPKYVAVAPAGWSASAVITRRAGTVISMDGEPVLDSEFSAVGDEFEVARVPINDDSIFLFTGEDSFGLSVVGYGNGSAFVTLGGWGNPVAEYEPTP